MYQRLVHATPKPSERNFIKLSVVYQSKFSVRLVVSFSSQSIRVCIASG